MTDQSSGSSDEEESYGSFNPNLELEKNISVKKDDNFFR